MKANFEAIIAINLFQVFLEYHNMLRRTISAGIAMHKRSSRGGAALWNHHSASLPPLSSSLMVHNPSTVSNSSIGACRYRSNRSRRGMYDGKDIRSGNNVSFSMKSTKRKFKPNVFLKRVYSEVLDEMIRFHLTTSTLRSIDKAGGLDNYLLTSKHVTSGEGLAAKKRVMNRLKYNARMEAKEGKEVAN